MRLPTRRQEQTAAAAIAIGVIIVGLIVAVVVDRQLVGTILFIGTLAVLAFIGVTNWLISRSRNGG